MNNKVAIVLVIIGLALVGWLVYRHNDMDSMPSDAMTIPADQGVPTGTTATTTTATGELKEFTVTSSNFAFAPKTLTVNKGDTVKINLVNSGGNHDLVIDEFNAKTVTVGSGQSTSITFIADKSGTFEYYCSIGNHRAMGMWGTLTVN